MFEDEAPAAKRRRVTPSPKNQPKIVAPRPIVQTKTNVFNTNDFSYSNLMKKMAEKYQDKTEEVAKPAPTLTALENPFLLPYINPFFQLHQHFGSDLLQLPLDLSGGPIPSPPRSSSDSSSTGPISPSARSSVEDWSIDSVSEFVSTVESCSEYAQVRVSF